MCISITWKLVRNAEAQTSTHLLNQNMHFQHNPQVIHMYLKVWEAMIYMILEKLGSGITNRNGCTGTLGSMTWKSTLPSELPWRIPGHYFKALLGNFAHDKPTIVYPSFSDLIITKGLLIVDPGCLDQGLINYSLQAKSSLLSCFCKQSFIGTQPHHLFTYYPWLLITAELSSCNRGSKVCKAQNIYHVALYRERSVGFWVRLEAYGWQEKQQFWW